jgi:hypothetical protein
VAPGDVPDFDGIDQLADGFPQRWEHTLEPCVKKQWFLVTHEKMIELHVKVRDVDGEPEQVGGDFIDGGHASKVGGVEGI